MIKLIKSTFYEEKKTKKKLNAFIEKAPQLSFGLECEQFEKNFAKYQGRKHCVFVNSGSSANLAIIQALLNLKYIKKGDFSGFSALTWATNVMPLIQLGLEPTPIDIELKTLNVSSYKLQQVLDKYPLQLLFLTNLLGFCDDIDKIKECCEKKGIILIEDNCESLGTVYKDQKLGNFGLASTFSFYVGHHLSTIEGGAICTDHEDLATMLRIVRAHGWDRNLDFAKQNEMRKKFKVNSTFYSRYTFYDLGFNLRPTEINGFIGNCQLEYIKKITQKRQTNFFSLARQIYQLTDRYYPIKHNHLDFVSNFAFPIICKSQEIKDRLVRACVNQVEIRPIVGGDITEQPFFKKYKKNWPKERSNATIAHEQGLYFGNNPELTNQEIQQIVEIFAK